MDVNVIKTDLKSIVRKLSKEEYIKEDIIKITSSSKMKKKGSNRSGIISIGSV